MGSSTWLTESLPNFDRRTRESTLGRNHRDDYLLNEVMSVGAPQGLERARAFLAKVFRWVPGATPQFFAKLWGVAPGTQHKNLKNALMFPCGVGQMIEGQRKDGINGQQQHAFHPMTFAIGSDERHHNDRETYGQHFQ